MDRKLRAFECEPHVFFIIEMQYLDVFQVFARDK